jgi:Mrp family chromosome partitioning ATPase
MSDTIISNGASHAVELHEAGARPVATSQNARGRLKRRRGAEPYDGLLWRLQSRQSDQAGGATLGLIGCEARTGVSTIAANLAVRASELGLGPVLLVETDSERPRLSSAWKLPGGPGLPELLSGQASFSECLRGGPADDLHVIPAAGNRSLDTAWDPGAIDALLAEARGDYRLVLFDLPPADRLHHAVLLARRLDQVLLVLRAEQSRGPAAQRAADRLLEDGVPLTGAVLNRERNYVPRWLSRWI